MPELSGTATSRVGSRTPLTVEAVGAIGESTNDDGLHGESGLLGKLGTPPANVDGTVGLTPNSGGFGGGLVAAPVVVVD
jgi:hypothetical protein